MKIKIDASKIKMITKDVGTAIGFIGGLITVGIILGSNYTDFLRYSQSINNTNNINAFTSVTISSMNKKNEDEKNDSIGLIFDSPSTFKIESDCFSYTDEKNDNTFSKKKYEWHYLFQQEQVKQLYQLFLEQHT